jgi:Cu2+-exporting ATPase
VTPLNCFHCGEPANGEPPITLLLDDQQRLFCCQGCKAVCETIHREGLTGFYDFRTEPAITPRQLTNAELGRLRELDHPLVQQSFVSPVKAGQEAQILIGGITCAACIWLLENHLQRQAGVLSFTVNYTTQRARLVWASDQVQLSDLLVAVHQLGYTARPYHADEVESALKVEHRSMLIRLAVAGIGSFQSMMLAFPMYFEMVSGLSSDFISFFRWFSLLVATPVVFYSAKPFFQNASRDLRSRHLTMDVPVAIAIGLAYGASAWVTVMGGDEVYFESVCMFTFFLLLGRYIEVQARYRAGLSGNALVGFQPRVATLVSSQDSETSIVATHSLKAGDVVRIRPGETLPVDGEILRGQSTLNEAALTGEYLPETRIPGDTVHAGSVNGENPLDIKVVSAGAQTRLSSILRVLDRVQSEKPKAARMADQMAGKFVGRVLILAPLVWLGWWWYGADNAFDITLSVLVVTCPCALSLATPTAITAATVKLRKLGLLPTRGHTLESMNDVDTVVFDKTGTLTRGELSLLSQHSAGTLDADQCLRLAAGLEAFSEHPIARVFHDLPKARVSNVKNYLGGGLSGHWGDQTLYIGHPQFVAEHSGLALPEAPECTGIAIWLASDQQWLARFQLDDQPRADAANAIAALHELGIRTLLLSGDRSGHVQQIARQLGIGEAIGQASPEDKLAVLQKLNAEGCKIMMVGDGLNDLPSMAGARVSVAMGSAADLTQLNLAALPLAAAGLVPPWLAAIGMSASSLVVVLNALRLGNMPTPARESRPLLSSIALP